MVRRRENWVLCVVTSLLERVNAKMWAVESQIKGVETDASERSEWEQ